MIEEEILEQYDVKPIGRTTGVEEKYYAITAERKIKHPLVANLRNMAAGMFKAD